MFFVCLFCWSSLRSRSLSCFAFASRLRFRMRFFVSVFSALLPPLPLPPLSFERQFGRDDDETKDRAFASRWSAFERRKKTSLASLARTQMKMFDRGGKRSIKMSSQPRRAARNTRVATKSIRYASSRLEARVYPFLLPFLLLPFSHEDVDAFVVVIVERRAKRKDARRRDGEAISIQCRERKGRCKTCARALEDANVRARRRGTICKDNRRFKSNSRESYCYY